MAEDVEISDPDDLYAIEPEQFVAARDTLVRRLRAEGRREEAAAVSKRRRPSATAWALDQVARRDPGLLEQALAAGARLREATEAAVTGDAASLRDAARTERAASDAVVDAAAHVLGERSLSTRTRLAATLRAAVLDDSVADELRRGVLATDHEAPGFGMAGFDVAELPASAGASAPKEQGDDKRQQREEAEAREQERRRIRWEREAEAARLEQRAQRLAVAADLIEEQARHARADADEALREADEARAAVDLD